MTYYRICPDCGAHLDPGERCACDIPRGPRSGGQHPVTGEELQRLRRAAIDGVITFDEFIRITTEILNGKKER